MLSPQQASEQLGVSLSLIYQLCKRGHMKHFRFGVPGKRGHIRIEESEVERYRTACASVSSPFLGHLANVGINHRSE